MFTLLACALATRTVRSQDLDFEKDHANFTVDLEYASPTTRARWMQQQARGLQMRL